MSQFRFSDYDTPTESPDKPFSFADYDETTVEPNPDQNNHIGGDIVDYLQRGFYQGVGGALDFLGADETAQTLYNKADEQLGTLTPEGKQALEAELFSSEGDYYLGEDADSPRAWLAQGMEMLGMMAMPIPGGAVASGVARVGLGMTKAAKALSKAKGIPLAEAKKQIAKDQKLKDWAATTLGYGGAEGATAAGLTEKEVRERILGMEQSVLEQSEPYQSALRETGDPQLARQQVAATLSKEAAWHTFGPTALLGAGAGRFYDDALRGMGSGSRLTNVGKGAVTESLEEMPQSAVETLSQNAAIGQVDPDVGLTDNLGVNVVAGGVMGGMMGGAIGGVMPKGSKPAPIADPNSEVGQIVNEANEQAGSVMGPTRGLINEWQSRRQIQDFIADTQGMVMEDMGVQQQQISDFVTATQSMIMEDMGAPERKKQAEMDAMFNERDQLTETPAEQVIYDQETTRPGAQDIDAKPVNTAMADALEEAQGKAKLEAFLEQEIKDNNSEKTESSYPVNSITDKGKPFKSERIARSRLKVAQASSTHEVKQVEGGYIGTPITPDEVTRVSGEGFKTKGAAQSRVNVTGKTDTHEVVETENGFVGVEKSKGQKSAHQESPNTKYDINYNLPKGTSVGGAKEIVNLADATAKGEVTGKQAVRYGVVQAEEAARLKGATGLDLDGYKHTVDNYGAIHTFNNHGNPKVEEARGQVAVTAKDFAKIPEIVTNPDSVELVGKDDAGRDLIRYKKRYNGNTYYVEEVRKKRRELMAKTLWKTRTREQMPDSDESSSLLRPERFGRNPPEPDNSIEQSEENSNTTSDEDRPTLFSRTSGETNSTSQEIEQSNDSNNVSRETESKTRPLKTIRIKERVRVADTGEEVEISMSAESALQEVDDRINLLEDLKACVKS